MTNSNAITLIIFSKNRPMQLDALLRSVKQNCDIFDEIIVQYDRDPKYSEAYKTVFNDHQEHALLIRERYFSDIHTLVHGVTNPYICFMVDDDIVYRKVPEGEFWTHDDHACFSLRLSSAIKNKVHFNYPLSVDGHIFHTDRIKDIFSKMFSPGGDVPQGQRGIENPNHLEAAMQGGFAHELPPVIMFHEQYLIGVPINRVSSTSHCAYGTQYGYTEDYLLEKYERGYRIDLEALDFGNPTDVHKEIELKFFQVSESLNVGTSENPAKL